MFQPQLQFFHLLGLRDQERRPTLYLSGPFEIFTVVGLMCEEGKYVCVRDTGTEEEEKGKRERREWVCGQ